MDEPTEKDLLENATAALEKSTGIRIDHFYNSIPNKVDARLTLTPPGEKKSRTFDAEIKKFINSSIIAEVAIQSGRSPERLVLIAEYVSLPQGEKLRELDIPYFDTAGNAFFNESGLYVCIAGQKRNVSRERTPGIFRPPGMKLIFAFLTQRGLEQESYRSISAGTGVPTPTVGIFMGDLKRTGFLIQRLKGPRQVVRRKDLLKRFVENYTESFRQTLKPVRFSSKKMEGAWLENIDLTKFNACWGGETGGAILTKHLRPGITTIYADSLLPELQAKYGLVRDENGTVEILRRFWKAGEIDNVAPPLVVYADLMGNAERRSIETAELIYDRYLTELTAEAP